MLRASQFALLSGILFCAPVAVAQVAPASPLGTVTGVAIDSVHGGYLKDGIVTVSNLQRLTTTDSVGRFILDSIPAGSVTLRLAHPLLDTLGIAIVTQQFSLEGGATRSFVLSVPSPATIVNRKCSDKERQRGDAAIAGAVVDAETGAPSVGAEVVVAWLDLAVGGKTISKTPQRRTAAARADGTFFLCGIPSDLQTGVIAFRGQDSTAEVPLSFGAGLVLRTFYLPQHNLAVEAKIPRSPTDLKGRVIAKSGKPIAGARIAIEADSAVALSDEDGSFRLNGVRAGTRLVTVRKLGFQPLETAVDVTALTSSVNFTLTTVTELKPVIVSALRDVGLQRVGFTERKRLLSGTFLGPREIEGKNSPKLGILLETIPVLKRYSCVRYWVDGHQWSSRSDTDASMGPDAFLSGAELGAVEVYGPNTAPGEYLAISKLGAPCAAVVVWTKFRLGDQ